MKDLNELYYDANITLTNGNSARPAKEILENRSESIAAFSRTVSANTVVDLTAMYYGFPVTDKFAASFADCFSKIDPTFSMRFVNEMRLLAGALLTYLAESDSRYSILAGLMVEVNQAAPGLRKAFASGVSRRILNKMNACRASMRTPKIRLDKSVVVPTVPTPNVDSIAKLKDWSVERTRQFQAANQSIFDALSALSVYREDSQILWWMTAQWCDALDKPLKELDAVRVCLPIAWEAARMVENFPGPAAMKRVISNMIDCCKDAGSQKKLELDKVISSGDNWSADVIALAEDFPHPELLPLSYALTLAENASAKAEWYPRYQRIALSGADFPALDAKDYGRIMYLECMAMRHYDELIGIEIAEEEGAAE